MLSLFSSTFALVMAGITWLIMRAAKRQTDKAKQGNLYRWAAICIAIASCSLIGSQFQLFATGVASHLPSGLVALAAVICAGLAIQDCWGKTNYAGKKTVIVAAIAPILLVSAPVSLLGIDPGQLVREVKTVSTQSGIVQTSGQ